MAVLDRVCIGVAYDYLSRLAVQPVAEFLQCCKVARIDRSQELLCKIVKRLYAVSSATPVQSAQDSRMPELRLGGVLVAYRRAH